LWRVAVKSSSEQEARSLIARPIVIVADKYDVLESVFRRYRLSLSPGIAEPAVQSPKSFQAN